MPADPPRGVPTVPGREPLAPASLLFALALALRLIPVSPLEPDRVVILHDVDGGSGLAVGPEGRSLALVTDQGELCEIDLAGKVLRRSFLGGTDFEDLAFRAGGRELWLISERRHELLTVDWGSLQVKDRHTLPLLSPEGHENKRFEGLAADPRDGSLWIAHERPGAIVDYDPSSGASCVRLINDSDVSAILAGPDGSRWIVVSRREGLRLYDEDGDPLGDWLKIDAQRAEGIAFVAGEGLFLLEDFKETRLLRFGKLRTWEAIEALLAR